jgi:hypothetical protein
LGNTSFPQTTSLETPIRPVERSTVIPPEKRNETIGGKTSEHRLLRWQMKPPVLSSKRERVDDLAEKMAAGAHEIEAPLRTVFDAVRLKTSPFISHRSLFQGKNP